MDLVILASDRARPAPRDHAWTLRLVGPAESGEVPPPDIRACAEEAAAEIRQSFPEWLWQWASDAGATEVQVFSGPISWWWLTELSEMSPLRSPVLRQLYWLALVRILIDRHAPVVVEWHGDDPPFDELVHRTVPEERNVISSCGVRRDARPLQSICREAAVASGDELCAMGPVATVVPTAFRRSRRCVAVHQIPRAVGNCRAPVAGTDVRHVARYIEARGHHVVYGAVYSGSPFDLLRRNRQIRRQRDYQICFLEAHLGLRDWLGSHLLLPFWFRYWRWRRSRRQQPVIFNGPGYPGHLVA